MRIFSQCLEPLESLAAGDSRVHQDLVEALATSAQLPRLPEASIETLTPMAASIPLVPVESRVTFVASHPEPRKGSPLASRARGKVAIIELFALGYLTSRVILTEQDPGSLRPESDRVTVILSDPAIESRHRPARRLSNTLRMTAPP